MQRQPLIPWINNIIKKNGILRGWIEERKFDWVSHMAPALKSLLHNGGTILIISDNQYNWFVEYILTNINSSVNKRPFLPFYNLNTFCSTINSGKKMDIELIKNMLLISFPKDYSIWYIGKISDKKSKLINLSKNRPIIWSVDEDKDSFLIPKENQDMRLLQLFKLLNLTIDGIMFNEIDLDA
jgi:hypothetical protein